MVYHEVLSFNKNITCNDIPPRLPIKYAISYVFKLGRKLVTYTRKLENDSIWEWQHNTVGRAVPLCMYCYVEDRSPLRNKQGFFSRGQVLRTIISTKANNTVNSWARNDKKLPYLQALEDLYHLLARLKYQHCFSCVLSTVGHLRISVPPLYKFSYRGFYAKGMREWVRKHRKMCCLKNNTILFVSL